jgi:polysaccharide export outer membrane protein
MSPKSNPMAEKPIKYFYTLIPVFLFLLSSCVTQRDVEYLQDKSKTTLTVSEASIADYKIKPNDELYIQINSLDDATANIFSGTGVQQSLYMSTIQPYGASLISFSVDKDGNVILPVIGKILVKDKTTAEVSNLIIESLTNILSQPVVSVKLVNRFVTVLGEVRNPGHFAVSQDKISIFDAIGLAGDVTDYGNRKKVLLVRNENGNNSRITVDLTKSGLMASQYYYIRPNDMIYIKPHKKFWGMRQFQYNVILTTITTAILVYSVTK